ncbi:MAG TPA: hypothetical protein VF656_17510 [Pyrinomonadaceae bacterium]|jgi:hypothetical protein
MLNLQQRRGARRHNAFACALVFFVLALAPATAVFVAPAAFATEEASRRAQEAAPERIPVDLARVQSPGMLVTVGGTVTVPSGAFKSGTSDEGFALQDPSGGLYVRTTTNLHLHVGQRVRVTGRLADSNGQRILIPAEARDVQVRGRGANIRAETRPTGRIGEATEGRLVRVAGKITKPVASDLPYGYRVFIDDGSGEVQAFVYVSTGIDVRRLRPGGRIEVSGFSGQYNDHYELIPRFQSDIRRLR